MGAFSGPREWGRLLTAMMTPFSPNGEVNLIEARRIAAYLVDTMQNDGLVINGTTGESPTLNGTEKFSLLEAVLDQVGDRAAVIFGAGTYSTAESIHNTRTATGMGAHGIMLVNPYYNKPGQEGLLAHFKAVAKETDLPVMLYNIQPRSSINLENPTLLELAKVSNIVAVKEASGNIPQISEACALVPQGFRVYSGDDGLTLPIMSLGGHGLVSVAAHLVGPQLKKIIELSQTNPAEARRVHQAMLPVFATIFRYPSPVPVKFALSLRGFDCASVRLPNVALNPQAQDEVRRMMQSLDRLG